MAANLLTAKQAAVLQPKNWQHLLNLLVHHPLAPCRRSRGATAVFAASDRPTIMYSANKKLLYSNLNENEVRMPCLYCRVI